MKSKYYSHFQIKRKCFISNWVQDCKKTLHLLKMIQNSDHDHKYTYPLPGGFLFRTLAKLSRREILELGIKLNLTWSEIQDLLIFTDHEELHLRCRDDYQFIKEHL